MTTHTETQPLISLDVHVEIETEDVKNEKVMVPGKVVGYTTLRSPFDDRTFPYYIVRLENPVYTRDWCMFIGLVVVHPDNVSVA